MSTFEVFHQDYPYPEGKIKSYSANPVCSGLFCKPDLTSIYVKKLELRKKRISIYSILYSIPPHLYISIQQLLIYWGLYHSLPLYPNFYYITLESFNTYIGAHRASTMNILYSTPLLRSDPLSSSRTPPPQNIVNSNILLWLVFLFCISYAFISTTSYRDRFLVPESLNFLPVPSPRLTSFPTSSANKYRSLLNFSLPSFYIYKIGIKNMYLIFTHLFNKYLSPFYMSGTENTTDNKTHLPALILASSVVRIKWVNIYIKNNAQHIICKFATADHLNFSNFNMLASLNA